MINEKRKDLEVFIREQTLGPGAVRDRFIDLRPKDTAKAEGPSLFANELINTIPAGVYSTGILFPVDDTRGECGEDNDPNNDEEGDKPSVKSQQDNFSVKTLDKDDEHDGGNEDDDPVELDSQSLNQMYPNSMGITVCLDPSVENDVEIFISGRYYIKVDIKQDGPYIAVLLEQDRTTFENVLAQLPADNVIRKSVVIGSTVQGTNYIQLAGTAVDTREVRNALRGFKQQQCQLLSAGVGWNVKSLDGLKEGLFNALKHHQLPDSIEGKASIEKLKLIERSENCVAHIQDLISIFDAAGYGLWRCKTFERRVGENLKAPDVLRGKCIYSHKKVSSLSDVYRNDYAKGKFASLSVNLQYARHKKEGNNDNKLFLKVQLLNTSTHFRKGDTRNGKNYFSMASEEINRRCFFGVCIRVRGRCLAPYRSLTLGDKEKYTEEEINQYIYRDFKDYGLGHGCSVRWGHEDDIPFVSSEYIPMQETPDVDPIPRDKLSPFEKDGDRYTPKPIFSDTKTLQFKWLSTLSGVNDVELVNGLKKFVMAYDKWIDQQQDHYYPAIAKQLKDGCKKDQARMLTNVELLLTNKEDIICFRLMNTAMFMQLWHSEKVKRNEVGPLMQENGFKGFFEDFYKEKADDRLFSATENAAWRPFQLAFVLLNLDGIFQQKDDPNWEARNEWVDLVWFPTGGGKTEAYLGLIALTIINRRKIFKEQGGGTAVIMRYTLRLLTTQQFQRATLLIMALELIRRWGSYDLGIEPIYIGLFVGRDSLPNKLKGEKGSLEGEYLAIQKAQNAGRPGRSKIPLEKCPWCGHELNPIKFLIDEPGSIYVEHRILLYCSRKDRRCAFSSNSPLPSRKEQGNIPVSLCDEEIYQHPPALLFGTVDKFAQIAHKVSNEDAGRNADSRRLFGKGNWEKGKPKEGYLPPDLVIQDELHLMMGPLGSAVALFESAIDQLCTRMIDGKPVRPKIISSTATTRNTPLQIMALFDRKVNLFPKPGIDCDDSFFAFYKRTSDQAKGGKENYSAKRRYIGILPTGRTQMWMQLRLAAIIFTHRALFEQKILGKSYPTDDVYTDAAIKAMDYYHTVLTYFNSLREVGKTESQIYSYLVKEIRRVFKVVRFDRLMHCFYTYNSSFHNAELTGRLSGEGVVSEMERIGRHWLPRTRLANGSPSDPTKGQVPPDLVIATNMISVGIDISRLNCMIVNCMPRNIAEYIQASSRVARESPGLVITVHHPFRSRDISHYERFIEFHEKMYSYVEPISITPFTRKALDRYLSLYVATIIRHKTRFVNRKDANNHIDAAEKAILLKTLTEYFRQRKIHLNSLSDIPETIRGLLTDDNLRHIDSLVDEAIEYWQEEYHGAVKEHMELVFNHRSPKASQKQLYIDINEYQDDVNVRSEMWRIPQSLRVVDPEAVIRVNPK